MIDEKGKKTKSLPTCKKEDDPQLHKAAKNKLAFFKKNIKSLIKQQTMNFARALHQGKQWPAARWRKLFLDHPLLAAMGQSLIWDGGGINGDRAGFRLSEDFSLLTVDDDTLDFDQLETVRLWHPMEWEEQAVTAWANHLKDYKLTPIIDQVSAPVHHLEGEEPPARELVRFQGYVTNQGSFRHILKKNGFAQDATEDGGRFYGHHLVAGARRLLVHLHHTPMTAWMEVEEEAAIEKVTFYDTETKTDLSLDQVNPRLIAWIIDVLEQIAQKGEGYQDDWHSLS